MLKRGVEAAAVLSPAALCARPVCGNGGWNNSFCWVFTENEISMGVRGQGVTRAGWRPGSPHPINKWGKSHKRGKGEWTCEKMGLSKHIRLWLKCVMFYPFWKWYHNGGVCANWVELINFYQHWPCKLAAPWTQFGHDWQIGECEICAAFLIKVRHNRNQIKVCITRCRLARKFRFVHPWAQYSLKPDISVDTLAKASTINFSSAKVFHRTCK